MTEPLINIIPQKRHRNIFLYIFVILFMALFSLPSEAGYPPNRSGGGAASGIQTTTAAAGTPQSEVLNNVAAKYKTVMENWRSVFQNAAMTLLFYLTVINLFWRAASLMFRGNNVADIFFELIRTVMIYGFFYFLITNISYMGDVILDSFKEMAKAASGVKAVSPSGMIDQGVAGMEKIFNNIGWSAFSITGIFLLFCGICCILVYTFVAINVLIATVVFYFILYAGAILIGFAGTEWTRNSALQYLNAVLAAGMRYMTTVMVAVMSSGVFMEILNQYKGGDKSWVPLSSLLVSLFLTYILIQKLPDMVSNLISPAGSGMGITSSGFAHATGIAQVGRAAQSMAMSAAKIAAVATGAGAVTMAAAGIKAVTGGVPGAIKSAMNGGSPKAGFMAGYDGGGAIGMAKSAMGAIGKTLNHIPPFRAASSAVKQALEKGGSQKAMASNMAADLRKDGMGAAEAKTKGQQMASQAQGYMRQGMGREAAKDMAYNDVMRRGGGDASRVTNATLRLNNFFTLRTSQKEKVTQFL